MAIKINTQGKANTMCRGRLTKLGTRPEKINEMWNVIDNTPKAAQKRRSNTDITNWLERWLEITPSQPVYRLKLFLGSCNRKASLRIIFNGTGMDFPNNIFHQAFIYSIPPSSFSSHFSFLRPVGFCKSVSGRISHAVVV